MRLSRGERITLYVMGVVGVIFWVGSIAWPGMHFGTLLLSGLLVAYVVFQFLVDRARGEEEE